eukprot:TRINITY_DN90607_c0_g1_i1.p1 TRINITY_DN90607_c0_g1~~TRINITY_DN90607_c0_g1_i1.p1  ORF type:complete len:273 (-),score=64.98 TRINITY_DN90607_c0_g1_i1:300-1118(-)
MANSNSYLRLQMEDETLETLRAVAHAIADDVPWWLLGKDGATNGEADAAASEAATGSVGFAPQEDLHITHAFFGEALQSHAGAADAICDIHRIVEESLSDKTLAVEATDSAAREDEEGGHRIVLEVEKFELFPPGKLNLVVARLKFRSRRDEIWARRLYLQVHDACKKAGLKLRGAPLSCESASDAAVMANSSDFQPHITLGKIQASAKTIGSVTVRTLNEQLTASARQQRLPLAERADGSLDGSVYISGIGMGGQPPKKVYFDWESLLFTR